MSQLSPQQWEKVRKRFESLCDHSPETWLQELADLDAFEREQVLKMLRAQSSDKLADSAAEQAPGLAQNRQSTRIGQRVDRFELTELLGAGGMGEVYGARRISGDYEQTVAVKLLATPLGDFVARFERERQLLAQLEHPNITRLLDGGTTDEGIPYLVMELVDGLPIDRYCEHHDMALADRVALAMQIVKAVAFAHSRLVLHRDIKPANVLVDHQGLARLMDFGIGTLLDATGQAEATRSGILTPTAAAPEQLRNERTSAATDVFQLGLLIYRMLTGGHPFDRSAKSDENSLAKQLLEQEPAPLSRRLEPRALPRVRDLEAVLARSLAVDPQNRYRSAAELLDDLEAWQFGRPVGARPLTPVRLSLRWAARNPLASGALLAAVISLIAGTGVATWQALEASQQLVEAQRSEAEANQVADFLANIFQSSNAFESQGEEPSASELLAAGVESIGTELAELPVVQARLLVTM
ncbi:MAG: serine/threonine-protein kinase, partial [Pseudomonadota bacterium]